MAVSKQPVLSVLVTYIELLQNHSHFWNCFKSWENAYQVTWLAGRAACQHPDAMMWSSFLLSLPCSRSWLPFMSFSKVIRVWHALLPEPREDTRCHSFLVVGIPGYNNLCFTFEGMFWHIKDHFSVMWGPWIFVRFFLDSLEHMYLTKSSHILVSSYSSGLNNMMLSI